MDYIVFDMEFNQDFASSREVYKRRYQYPFEIIQIGAVKLDSSFKTVGNFNRYISPTMYSNISPIITDLTGINIEKLIGEDTFPEVLKAFIDFIGDTKAVFCVWGMSDMRELFRNVKYHELSDTQVPKDFINIQPYASRYLGTSSKNLLRLKHVVEALNIPISYEFHNAFYDSYYTSEIFKKIYSPIIQPKIYDPTYVKSRDKPVRLRRTIDFEQLIAQFSKMYNRDMIPEEVEIIKLAYLMGKTHQFMKPQKES